MPAIHVRDVPEAVVTALRERAALHGRSMQREILQILEAAASDPLVPAPVEPVGLRTVRTQGTSTWVREEIYGVDGR